jgi:predicted transcriptional regulator YheO
LAAWIALPLPTATATALFPGDWRESINQRIATFLAERDATLAGLASADVHALIAALDQSGVFEIRHAVGYVASVLGVSRATLYQRLKTVRAQPVRRSPRQGARHAKPRA